MKKPLSKICFLLVLIIIIVGVFFSLRPKQISSPVPGNPASQICQKINREEVKYSCLALVNQDEKYCQSLDNDPKNVCLATLNKDDSFCQKVSETNRQYCYQNLVSASGKSSFCDKLNGPEEISSCYVHFVSTNYFISNLQAINQSMCDKVLKDQPEQELCLAMTTQDITACSPARIDCPAYVTKDLTLCSKSASKTDESECYHALAMLKQDSTLCERIDDTEAKDNCYRDYSRLSQDQMICNKILSPDQKDECLKNIALNISLK